MDQNLPVIFIDGIVSVQVIILLYYCVSFISDMLQIVGVFLGVESILFYLFKLKPAVKLSTRRMGVYYCCSIYLTILQYLLITELFLPDVTHSLTGAGQDQVINSCIGSVCCAQYPATGKQLSSHGLFGILVFGTCICFNKQWIWLHIYLKI